MHMLIGGRPRFSSTGKVIEVRNPADNHLIDSVPDASREDVREAVLNASGGAEEWKSVPLHERIGLVRTFCSLLDRNAGELAELQTREMGRPISQSKRDIPAVRSIFEAYCEAAGQLPSQVMPVGTERGKAHDIEFTLREPLGIVVCIVPFNGPLVLFAHKAAPALIMGNAVIAKPTSDNPLALLRLGELMLEAGIPGNVIQFVTGRGSTVGQWLVENPDIAKVSFTGSLEVGRSVALAAAGNLARSTLELGGNAPFILLDDGDFDLALNEAVAARVLNNNGQVCNAPKRFLIHRSRKRQFIEALIERLSGLRIGDPMDPAVEVGTLISEQAAVEVEAQIRHTVKQGAVLVHGGVRSGARLTPAVLDQVTADMDIARDLEIFGPVLPVISFDSDEEAIRIANATMYGLGCGVFTSNLARAMNFVRQAESGSVIINGSSYYRSLHMPFGGYKKSGIGREGLTTSLEGMSQLKCVVLRNVL